MRLNYLLRVLKRATQSWTQLLVSKPHWIQGDFLPRKHSLVQTIKKSPGLVEKVTPHKSALQKCFGGCEARSASVLQELLSCTTRVVLSESNGAFFVL